MQISDGDEYLDTFFDEGNEVIGYADADEMIDKIKYYLSNDSERERVARNGYRRVLKDYRMSHLLHKLGQIIREAAA
jgi:spore maturation protein CgeB